MKVRTIPKTTSLATAGTGAPPQGRARIPWDAAGAGLPNILDMDKHGLRGLFAGEPYRGDQVYGWLFSKGVQDFNDMTDLPKDLRARLASQWAIAYPEVVSHKVSADGTEKFAYALADGCIVESVLIPEKGHYSVCVSSQVGCAMGCRFCLTATRGFTRNLSPGEIVSQVLMPIRAYPERRFTNVVFMGMGEP
ncbi:MAG TPA: 23S rRNA (adenine(2503)-C(2))-methyltransferase RlmN, partial [Deltaproteobacteria bacterium]|nr:23S rRNA (adenine(2503)-C(2))-methyltransferase RlmN [Deltaproteobacteria bacterium]